MQLIVSKYLDDAPLRKSQFSYVFGRASPKLSSHSYNFDVFLAGVRTICEKPAFTCVVRLIAMSHGDPDATAETQ
jgi:hypothetical protein